MLTHKRWTTDEGCSHDHAPTSLDANITDRNFRHLNVNWSIVREVTFEQDVLDMSQS
jgi:hypothetical protein